MRECLWRMAVGSCVALGLMSAASVPAADAPVVPGYWRLKEEAKADPAALGEVLLGELNCASCHAAPGQTRIVAKGAPDLTAAGARISPQYLEAYLAAPHAVKPGTTMPDLLHDSSAKATAEALAHFLASRGGPLAPATEEGNAELVGRGRQLYHEVGCVACHAPEKPVQTTTPSVPLADLAEKTTVDQLEAFLLDPLKVRPGSRMPSLHLGPDEAHALAVYLLRDQLNDPAAAAAPPTAVRGARYEYFEGAPLTAALEQIGKLKAKSHGRTDHIDLNLPGLAKENFALKFTATLHIARAGRYVFHTTSDDGSRLYIDSKLVVDNDGVHPAAEKKRAIDLREGDHALIVTYFQGGSQEELKVEWEGPQVRRETIPASVLSSMGGRVMIPLHNAPFVVDDQKAAAGAKAFASLGCVACHASPGVKADLRPTKPLADVNPDAPGSCLSGQPAAGVPEYDLSAEQIAALKAALKNAKSFNQPLPPQEQVSHLMAALNCYACHVRGAVGGPTDDRKEFFVMATPVDMGDEGRYPPRLTGVGAKLKPEAIEQIIAAGKLHVRPQLATRMPEFGKELAASLSAALAKADGPPSEQEPAFTPELAKDGRQLVGTKGLGCVNCHGMNGIKSLGMPAPDLGTAHDRLRPNWFRSLLVNPAEVNPGTRMPQFWVHGDVAFPKIAGGTMDSQIGAIWDYLSQGENMVPPVGLVPAGDELIPADVPIIHRTQMAGVGNRTVLVGFPEAIHVAFDADVVRLAEAWKGRFFDAQGMWEERGGKHLAPLGTDIISMPAGPALAVLETPDSPWPEVKAKDRNVGGHFKGYALDKQDRPTFHYELNGIDVYEQPLPVFRGKDTCLQRKFQLSCPSGAKGLYFLAAEGKKIEPKAAGEWLVDDKATVRIAGAGAATAVIRDANGLKQLLLPIVFQNGANSFTTEMSW